MRGWAGSSAGARGDEVDLGQEPPLLVGGADDQRPASRSVSVRWLCGTILVLYFVLMKFVPVPGHGAGILEPTTNWSNYIDRHLLAGHMQTPIKEPKSLLGNFPALVTRLPSWSKTVRG